MIEGKLAMTGRITGFRAGDKQIQLNWDVTDGDGDFLIEDIPPNDTGFECKVSEKTTMIIFIPGKGVPVPDLEDLKQAVDDAQDALDNKKKADPTNVSTEEANLKTAEKELKQAEEVRISISDKSGNGAIPISGVYPTILTSDAGKEEDLFIKATTGEDTPRPIKVENCELITL